MSTPASTRNDPTGNDPTGNEPTGNEPTTHTPTGLIAFAWALVGVPLAYGLYNTVKAASALFG